MLRLNLLLVICVFLFQTSFAQHYRFQRELRFSNVLYEQGMSVADAGDGYILAGNTIACSNGSCDFSCALARTDEAGNTLWVNRYGTTTIPFNSVEVINGHDESFILLGRGFVSAPRHNSEVFLVKVDTNGTIIWKTLFGGADDDVPVQVHAIDGGYFITGHTLNEDNDPDGFVAKVKEDGQLDWFRQYGTEGYETSFGGSVMNHSGNIVVASGYKDYPIYEQAMIEFDLSGNIINQTRYTSANYTLSPIVEDVMATADSGYIFATRGNNSNGTYLVKVDSLFQLVWTRKYMNGTNFYRGKVSVTGHYNDGGFWMGGTTGTSSWSTSTWHHMNSDGEILSSFKFDSPNEEKLNDIVPVNYCQLAVIGRTKSSGPYRWWLAVTDSLGNPGCVDTTRTFTSDTLTIMADTIALTELTYAASGEDANTLSEPSSIMENDTFCIDTTEICTRPEPPIIDGIVETESGPFTVYPNPVTDDIMLAIPQDKHGVYELTLYDLFGRKVWHQILDLSSTNTVNGFTDLTPGGYILVGHSDDASFSLRVMKQ